MSDVGKWNPQESAYSRLNDYVKLPEMPVRSAFGARWCKEEDDKRYKHRLTEIDKKNIVIKQVLDRDRHVADLEYEDREKQRKHEAKMIEERKQILAMEIEAKMIEERKQILAMEIELLKLKQKTGTLSNVPESAQDYSSTVSDHSFDRQLVIRRSNFTWAPTPHVTEVDEEEETENALGN